MADYTKATDFAAKDALLTGNPNKIVKGTEIDDEFAAIATAIATKYDSADLGVTLQAYDADTAKYDATTANFTGTLQNGGSNVVVDSDIGSTVQAYDADTAKLDVAQTWTATQTFLGVRDTTASLSGTTPAISVANGNLLTWTLTGNSTPTDSLSDGDIVEIHIDDGTAYTITWTMVDEWIGGSAPTLDTTNTTVVFLEKVGSTVIGRAGGVSS